MTHSSFGKALHSVLFLFLLLIPSAVWAQDPLLPAMYRVSGLAASDELNIRSEDNADSAIIGRFPLGKAIEIIVFNTDETWAKVIWEEGNGWVSRAFLSGMTTGSFIPEQLFCSGTEPFWILDLRPADVLIFENATDSFVSEQVQFASISANSGPYEFAFASKNITGFVRRDLCSEGMSDREYGWRMSLIDNKNNAFNVRSGCCSLTQN